MRRRPMLPDVRRDVALRPTPVRTFDGRVEALPAGIVGASGNPSELELLGGPKVEIHHVTLLGTPSQTVTAGGSALGFNQIASAPTEVRGFPTLLTNLATTGEVFAIPISLTGDLELNLRGKWGDYPDGFKCSGTLTLTRTRGGTVATKTYTLTPAARRFQLDNIGWEVEAGDTLTVTLPNGSGSSQTLAEAELALRVIGVASATSTVQSEATSQVHAYFYNDNTAQWYLDGTELTAVGGDLQSTDVVLDVAAGDHLFAVKATQATGPAGANPAAICLAIYEWDGTTDGALLFSTAQTANWDCQDYPGSDPTGWPNVSGSAETWTAVVVQPQAGVFETSDRIWSQSGSPSDPPVGTSYFRGFWTVT